MAKLVLDGMSEEKVPPLAKMFGHLFLTFYNMEYKKDYEEARRQQAVTLALAPSDPFVICNMALISIGLGEPDDAIALVTPIQDLRSDNVYASPQYALGRAHFGKGDYARAAEFLRQAPADAASSLPFLAASYAEIGDAEQAKVMMAKALAAIPNLSIALMRRWFPNRDESVLARQDEALRKAGLPEA